MEMDTVPKAGRRPRQRPIVDAAPRRGALTSVDLFCGAGGLTLGLANAQFETVLASDFWTPAAETFTANFPEMAFACADIRDVSAADVLKLGGISSAPTLVAGGPPCQGFSSAGARQDTDHRNSLVGEFSRLVCELRPRAFLFENVEGFLTTGGGRFVFDLLEPVIEAGYRVSVRKLNVANWGVPQLRKRVIAIGLLDRPLPIQTPTHRAHGAPGVHHAGHGLLPLVPNIDEALAGLPTASKHPPGSPTDHYAPALSDTDLERVSLLRPGQTMRDLPERLQHGSYQRRANRRVADGMPTERRGGAPAGLRRLRAEEPSKAITSAAPREFIHPHEDRPLTLRECARLQTFPDNFQFLGSRSERQVLVGNAVPPLFAECVGNQLFSALTSDVALDSGGGGLDCFDVVNGSGMSPALEQVIRDINKRFGGSRAEQLSLNMLVEEAV
ncbi:MAG: DNA cytosine methyltransferase [Acidimicrobiales bacterium]